MRNVAVFCGSSPGREDEYRQQAYLVGKYLANQSIGLVYGGAQIGIMGAVAEGALNNGGTVVGVIPSFLMAKEIVHHHLTELIVVSSMHERKAIMNEKSDGFIMLPGGLGTLEEFFEVLTWAQLGLHRKPIGILNTRGFYDFLLQSIDHMIAEAFVKDTHKNMIQVATDIETLVKLMKEYKAPNVPKWIQEGET